MFSVVKGEVYMNKVLKQTPLKRFLSLFVALAMCLGILPADVFAAGYNFVIYPGGSYEILPEALYYPIPWETDFYPKKVEIVLQETADNNEYVDRQTVFSYDPTEKKGTIPLGANVLDEQAVNINRYVLRAYYGSGKDDYIQSSYFYLSERSLRITELSGCDEVTEINPITLQYNIKYKTNFRPTKIKIVSRKTIETDSPIHNVRINKDVDDKTLTTITDPDSAGVISLPNSLIGNINRIMVYFYYGNNDLQRIYIDENRLSTGSLRFTSSPSPEGTVTAEGSYFKLNWSTNFTPEKIRIVRQKRETVRHSFGLWDTAPYYYTEEYTDDKVVKEIPYATNSYELPIHNTDDGYYILYAYYDSDSFVSSDRFYLSTSNKAFTYLAPNNAMLDPDTMKYEFSWKTNFNPLAPNGTMHAVDLIRYRQDGEIVSGIPNYKLDAYVGSADYCGTSGTITLEGDAPKYDKSGHSYCYGLRAWYGDGGDEYVLSPYYTLSSELLKFEKAPLGVLEADRNTLRYNFSWETSFEPDKLEIYRSTWRGGGTQLESIEERIAYKDAVINISSTDKKRGNGYLSLNCLPYYGLSYASGNPWTYELRAYFGSDEYDYVSTCFSLAEQEDTFNFTAQPEDTKLYDHKYYINFETSFVPQRMEMCGNGILPFENTDKTSHHYSVGEDHPTGDYWIRAYYVYDPGNSDNNKYIDSKHFSLIYAEPSFKMQPDDVRVSAESETASVSWTVDSKADCFSVVYWDKAHGVYSTAAENIEGGYVQDTVLRSDLGSENSTQYKIRAHYGDKIIESEPFTVFGLQNHFVDFRLNYGSIDRRYKLERAKTGQTVSRPEDPDPTDYNFPAVLGFIGWYTESQCINEYDFNTPVSDNITLYAKWSDVHKISFNINGNINAVTPDPQYVRHGDTVKDPYANGHTSPDGYKFLYWCTDPACENKYDLSAPVMEDLKLYGKWQYTRKYKVKVHYVGGFRDGETYQYSVEPGETFADNAVDYDAYAVLGHYTDPECTQKYDFSQPVNSDLHLYKKCEARPMINYYCAGGLIGEESVYTRYYTLNSKPSSEGLPTPVREGYTFASWYVDPGFIAPFTGDEPVTENTNVYAKWEPGYFTVTFDTQGGSKIPSQQVKYNEWIDVPETEPAKSGHTFTGWFVDPECTVSIYTGSNQDISASPHIIKKNTTFYAGWKETGYVIQLIEDGAGSVSINGLNEYFRALAGTQITLSVHSGTAEKATWKTENGEEHDITDTLSFTMPDESVIVNVVFKEKEEQWYRIYLDRSIEDGNQTSLSARTGVTGTEIEIHAVPAGNYVFDRWEVISGGVTLDDPASADTSFTIGTEDVEIKAVFTKVNTKQFSIDFENNDGSTDGMKAASEFLIERDSMTSVDVKEGENFTLPECTMTPPKGKMFDKWLVGTLENYFESYTETFMAYSAGDEITVTDDLLALPCWKDRVYTWIGEDLSGTYDGNDIKQVDINYAVSPFVPADYFKRYYDEYNQIKTKDTVDSYIKCYKVEDSVRTPVELTSYGILQENCPGGILWRYNFPAEVGKYQIVVEYLGNEVLAVPYEITESETAGHTYELSKLLDKKYDGKPIDFTEDMVIVDGGRTSFAELVKNGEVKYEFDHYGTAYNYDGTPYEYESLEGKLPEDNGSYVLNIYEKEPKGNWYLAAKFVFRITPDIKAQIFSHTLTLEGQIGVNTYIIFSDEVIANAENYQVEFFNGLIPVSATKVSEASTAEKKKDGKTYYPYCFTFTTVSKEIGTPFTMKIYDISSGKYIDFYTSAGVLVDGDTGLDYAIEDYLDDRIKHSENADMVELAKDMSAYGKYSKHYFDVRDKGSSEPLPEVTGFVPVTPEELEAGDLVYKKADHDIDGFTYGSTTLVLEDQTTFRLYFRSDDISKLTIMNGSKVMQIKEGYGSHSGMYYVEVPNISAPDLDIMYDFEIGNGIETIHIIHGPMGYVYWALSASSNTNLKYAMMSLYHYNISAKKYFSART